MFMHNGQVGNWVAVRERVADTLPDELRSSRRGSTDSEAFFLSAIAHGLERNPIAAIEATLAQFQSLGDPAGGAGHLRFAAAVSDGCRLWAFRWASDARPPTLYYRSASVASRLPPSRPTGGCPTGRRSPRAPA